MGNDFFVVDTVEALVFDFLFGSFVPGLTRLLRFVIDGYATR